MSKTCKNCGSKNENPLLKYCKKCIYENSFYNLKQTRINIVSDKKKERIKNGGSEKDLFKEIWEEREHICEICNKQILEAKSYCFAHKCPKGTYPEHRLKKENISLVCSIKCHGEVDKIFNGIKRAELNLIL